MNSDELIKKLDLIPLLPEGGYFKQVYKSKNTLNTPYGVRSTLTSIYYLLDDKTYSCFHKLPSDEIYHFYNGDRVELYLLFEDGTSKKVILGEGTLNGESCQYLVPANTWQASKIIEGGKYALLGTTMSPGYEDADFILGTRQELINKYPKQVSWLEKLVRE